eukprot:scaffold84548_cov36-Phaeocystis_antarctica.AAC.1
MSQHTSDEVTMCPRVNAQWGSRDCTAAGPSGAQCARRPAAVRRSEDNTLCQHPSAPTPRFQHPNVSVVRFSCLAVGPSVPPHA